MKKLLTKQKLKRKISALQLEIISLKAQIAELTKPEQKGLIFPKTEERLPISI